VPFDLRHHRFIQYLNNGEGLQTLQKKLISRLCTLAGTSPIPQPPGARVFHARYGDGSVIGVDGTHIKVSFDNAGVKTIVNTFLQFYRD
jgi:hypothetical protein